MFDLEGTRNVAMREISGLVDRAGALTATDWERPSLPSWTIRDLLDHSARALHQQAEAIANGLAGRTEQPGFPHPRDGTPAQVLADLVDGRSVMGNVVAQVAPVNLEQLTPMPFGVVPTPVALMIAVAEYAMHRWDLERAVGNATYAMPQDAAALSFHLMAGLLPTLAAGGTAPAEPLAFTLRCPDGDITLMHDGSTWGSQATPNAPTCRIEGSTSDVVMFTVGRSQATTTLEISGDRANAATSFKTYFPGP
jgi:uncharacterized protein (TIGR03083 family)